MFLCDGFSERSSLYLKSAPSSVLTNGYTLQLQIKIDDTILNSDKVLNAWLNAYEYHRSDEKREFLEGLNEMLPLDASKVLFLGLLAVKMQAIHNIVALIRVVLGKQKSLEI